MSASAFILAGAACQSAFAEAGGSGGGAGAEGGVPGVASRYVIRLQERVKKADEAALRGSQLMADEDYQGAIEQYRAALDLLPDAKITEARRAAYTKQYANASVRLAEQRAEEGEYAQATQLVQNVLQPNIDPDNLEAKRLLSRLQDPEYYSPALTPAHLEKVRRVEFALKVAQGHLDLGDYDGAERRYNEALTQDPYNTAARRGLEANEQERLEYFEVARNQTRATFMRKIAEGWEMPVPVGADPLSVIPGDTDTETDRISINEQKLKKIILPSVEFVDTPLRDALAFLQQRSVELDSAESDPSRKGVNFILDEGLGGGVGGGPAAPAGGGGGFEGGFEDGGAAPAGGGFGVGGGVGDTRITLRLQNVPLVEALRYTTSLAQMKYKVEPNAVLIIPLSRPDDQLYTNTYTVPPTFITSAGSGPGGGGAAAAADPFADPVDTAGAGPSARPTARQVLEGAGVVFPPGGSASFNPRTSQLIVRTTQDQMELVEIFLDSITTGVEKQIFITSRFIEISQEDGKELGFDWLLGPFNIGSAPKAFGGGGTAGNGTAVTSGDYTFNQNGVPVGANPVTAGLRSGGNALDADSIDGLISEASGSTQGLSAIAPAIFGIAGVFTDPQFQVMIRALRQRKGVDLMTAPSVMARSGQRAKIEVIREFIYPTEYDPPEIPNQVGTTGITGPLGGSTGTFPVTPATPTAFETRNTGVTLEVDPVLGADNFTIDLNLSPEVVEFEGFINYGSPISSAGFNAAGQAQQVVITENRIEMPVFNTRKVTTQVTIWDQQTVALGGLIREDVQEVEDKVPFLGDLPIFGRLFRNNVELHLKRNLTIFVTAKIQDPAGLDINNRFVSETEGELDTSSSVAPAPAPVGGGFAPSGFQK